VDCWITLGAHLEVQNLSVAFSVPWFPKDLICHDNSSDTQAYLDSARYYKLKVSELQAIAGIAG
jgi:hypothetical protein